MTSKKFNIVMCAFLFFLYPAFAAPGDRMTSTIQVGQTTFVVITEQGENETEHEHNVRHKQILDNLKKTTGAASLGFESRPRFYTGSQVPVMWTKEST